MDEGRVRNDLTPPVALTIAGSDSGGGAGIQADLLTFSAFRVHGTTVLTAITAQNTVGVQAVEMVDIEMIRRQIDSVTVDFQVRAAKTGMLGTAPVVDLVRTFAESSAFKWLVVDPVMIATSGARLLAEDARDAYLGLLPFTDILTPNIAEAEYLLGSRINDQTEMTDAAKRLAALGARSVLLKGGHLSGETAADIYFDGTDLVIFDRPMLDSRNVHGTGCTLSAAITAGLALGLMPIEAIARAKEFIHLAIANAIEWRLGSGAGPVDHFGDQGSGSD